MKALAVPAKGAAAAVLDVHDTAPGAGEIRVAIEAASVNGFDLSVAAGRIWDAMAYEFPVVLGRDYVGVVESVGDGVQQPRPGDRVAGTIVAPALGPGAIAERLTTPAWSVTVVPENVSTADAAAVGLAACAGYDALAPLDVGAGDTVLVAGATGGVGSVAVQLAVARGATVLATARPGEETDYVRSLGAAHAVDYSGDLNQATRAIVPDGVSRGLHAAGDPVPLAAAIRPGGQLTSLLGATAEQVGRDDITVTPVVAQTSAEKLAELLTLVADGRLRVTVNASFPLDRATDALEAFRAGTLGKVLVNP